MKVNDTIILRKFSLKDLNRIMEIENASFASDVFSKNIFLNLYRKCSNLFIIAEISKIIAGYMITCNLYRKWKVISIAIDPIYRCKGIGSYLANTTFDQLKASSAKSIELEVRITNTEGICFWKSLGFLPLKIIPNYYHNGKDALIMRKLL
jgi:[ribosomal protein S18]-alanine N-acetyltransferase